MPREKMGKTPRKEFLEKMTPEQREKYVETFKELNKNTGCLLSVLGSSLSLSGILPDISFRNSGQPEGTNTDNVNKYKRTEIIFRLCLFTVYFILLFIGLWKINTIKQYPDISLEENGTVTTEIHNTCFFAPHDVSQSRYIIKPSNNCNIDTICINLGINAIFTPQEVEPDRTTLTSIIYTDKYKVETINKKGLSFYVKYPDQQNKQSVRFFVLTALMTLCLQGIFKAVSGFLLTCYLRLREKRAKNNKHATKNRNV